VYERGHTANDDRVRLNPRQAFGQRVKELRAAREITQDELAERVGVFRTYLSRIETGAANPTLSVIHALADALRVPVVALFEPPGSAVPARTRSRQGASRGRVAP
jgi:transcriptional regulator with XRE-family HTH domain